MKNFGFVARDAQGNTVSNSNQVSYSLIFECDVSLPSGPRGLQVKEYDFDFPLTVKDEPLIAIKFFEWNFIDYYIRPIGQPFNWTGVRIMATDIRRFPSLPNSPTIPARGLPMRVYIAGYDSANSFGVKIKNKDGFPTLNTDMPQLSFTSFIYSGTWDNVGSGEAGSGGSVYSQYKNKDITIPADSWNPISLNMRGSYSVLVNGVMTMRVVVGLTNILAMSDGKPLVVLTTSKLYANAVNVPNLTLGSFLPIISDNIYE